MFVLGQNVKSVKRVKKCSLFFEKVSATEILILYESIVIVFVI